MEEAEKTGAVPPGSSLRSIHRYRRWFREGERQFGCGFAGLVRSYGRRPGTSDLGDAQQQVLEEVVELFAEDRRAGRVAAAYARLVALCQERGIDPPPSRETLRRALKRRSLEDLAREREGPRAADQLAGPVPKQSTAVPVEPDKAFQIAHVDHVLLDIQLVSGRTGALLGRPWLTLIIDAWSRMPLATSMSFDAPSRVALSEVLLDCVARHHCVPDNLVADQGSEFQSVDFEVALAFLGVNKIERPASRPRFGAVMERMFGIANTAFIHELKGNTRLAQRGRNLSATHHPTRHATWTLSRLHEVCEKFLFEVYPDLKHGTLGVTRRQAFDHSVALSGERVKRYVPFDDALRMLLALTPRRPTRKVDSVRGITVDHLRYWHDAFKAGDVAGYNVPVKLDPMDCSVLFAQVRGEWMTCRLADGDADLGGRSWRQVRLIVQELRGQRRVGAQGRQDNARVLGDFLLETDLKGDLARQVDRDEEAQAVRSARPAGMGSPVLRLVKNESLGPLEALYSSTPLVLGPDDDDALEGIEPCDSTV